MPATSPRPIWISFMYLMCPIGLLGPWAAGDAEARRVNLAHLRHQNLKKMGGALPSAEVIAFYDTIYVAETASTNDYKDTKLKRIGTYKGSAPSSESTRDWTSLCVGVEWNEAGRRSVHGAKGKPPNHIKRVVMARRGESCHFWRTYSDVNGLDDWQAMWDEKRARGIHILVDERCGDDTSDFARSNIKRADLVVGGVFLGEEVEGANFRVDYTYVDPDERGGGLLRPGQRHIAVEALDPDKTLVDADEEVILLLKKTPEGTFSTRTCHEDMRYKRGRYSLPVMVGRLQASSFQQSLCPAFRDMKADSASSNVVFHAHVDRVRFHSEGHLRVQLSRIRNYKGEVPEEVIVTTGTEHTSDLLPLHVSGVEVLVFGRLDEDGMIHVDPCGATRHTTEPSDLKVEYRREDVFTCPRDPAGASEHEDADMIGHAKLVRVDTSTQPPLAEFVVEGFYKGAEYSDEGRVRVRIDRDDVRLVHDVDTLLYLKKNEDGPHFSMTSCGAQTIFYGAPPRLEGEAPVAYDPKVHKSSCAAAPVGAPANDRAFTLALALLAGASLRRRRRGPAR